MFLLLSGEGATDIGTRNDAIGPMSWLVDGWIERNLGYSLVDAGQFNILTEHDLTDNAKSIKPLSRKGKRQKPETRFFYKNARALAQLANEMNQDDVLAILFRDADGTVSSGRGEWSDKWQSMLDGFTAEGFDKGVPMLPKPKSEAWILCALDKQYRHCDVLEEMSGNDNSPNAVKVKLAEVVEVEISREWLNEQVAAGEIDIGRINMPSANAFRGRVDAVLDMMGVAEYG